MTTKLFKTMNIIRSVSGASLNLFRCAAMVIMLLTLGAGNAWGDSHSTHTATLNVKKGTGSGTVYASTSGSATSGSTSASFNCGGSESGQHTGTLYAYATPASGYTFLGWTTSASSSAGADNSNPKGVAFNVTNGSSTQTLYAHFVEKAQVNITFEAPSNGTYTIKVNGGSTETVSSANVVKSNVEGVTLTATPASGYAFAGWYKLNSAGEFVEDLSIESPYEASFTASETIKMGARFVPTTLGKFILKGSDTQYYGLKMATVAAGGSGIIVPVADETLVDGSDLMPFDNGTYSIKAGATLLVPYSLANTVQTAPQIITKAATLSAYKTLVFTDGVNVECDGTICVGGQIMAGSGGSMSGYVSGPCGMINMANGGHIELNSGAKLYCWGFIKGQDMDQGNNTVGVGTITANSGAEVWENLGIGDWRGGTATGTITNTRFFPFQSYFIQNIEVPLTIEYGAAEKNYIALNATGGPYNTSATTIGSSKALFLLKDANSTFRKWYDPTTDLTCFELSGTSQIDALAIKISALGFNIDVNSADFDLPINSSMHIILTNSSVTLSKPMVLQPGAVIEVKNDANITLSSNAYLYDKDNWGAYAGPSYYFHSYPNLTSHKNRGNGKSNALLDDAKVIVDGTVSVTGKLYSTAAGANVMGNGGGKIVFSTSLPTATTIPAFTGNGDAVSGGVAVNSANLCNEDESYTKAIASTTFHNVNGRWFAAANKDENESTHVYDHFIYISAGQPVSGSSGSTTDTKAVYAPDKTGLVAGMKWCNVEQDATCTSIYNAIQSLNETDAANIRYTYPSDEWLQLLKISEGLYNGSNNNLYALESNCTLTSLGAVDENCLYTVDDTKKAYVNGSLVALAKNTNDEAWHNTADATDYYICFAGCNWHHATKEAEEKAYKVEDSIYIWYSGDWKAVEREDPFFFDYNDQKVKRYYEYENDEWVLADPKVRVTDAIETRDFFFLPEAFAIANGKKNATITILKDITDTTTPLSYTQTNTTCTLDLNGHTVNLTITGSGTTGVNMIKIDASGSTFTITDNSAEKDGKLILKQGITTATATKRWYGIVLANGSLALNAGEVQAINDFTYTSTKNTGMISAIYIAAGKTFTMNGGSIYAESPYYPRAIEIAGSASANATVTLNTGTITANATTVTNAMGIYTVGGTTTIKEGVTINATTKTTSAYGIYVDASTSGYWGTVNMTGGTVNATATTTTALGAFVNGTYTFNNTTPNTIKGTYRAVLSISGGSFNVETLGTTTAYGIQTRGTTTITGGTFNVTPKTTTAYGLLVQDGTTTISGTPTFTIKGTTTAYGIYANAATPEDKTGRSYNPNVIVNGGTFDVTTTTGDVAYGVYAGAGTRVITSTASDCYPGIYSSIGTVAVNGGTFNVTAKTYNAIGVYVHRVAAYESGTNTAHVFRGVANIAGGTFTVRDLTHKTTTGACDGVRSYGTLNITGGSFDVAASAATAKNATYVYGVNVYDGTATVSGTPEFTVSAYGTAYGAVANGATPDKATGLPCEADLTIDGGTFNVNTTTSTTAYGVYAAGPAPRVITSTAAGYYPGTYYSKPVATVNDGTFNVKAKTTTAIGAYCGRGVLYDQEVLEPHTVELESFGELNIKGGTFNVSTLGTTTADGVRSFGTTNITGGTFNVTPKTTTATAIRTYAGKTTITDNPHFTVKGTTTVYGLLAGCEAPNAKSGLTYNGEIECNGGTFDLETTTGATCYGVYAFAGSVKITTLNSADANYFAGNYASAGTIVVNDGIFNVKAKTTGVYGVVVPAAVSQSGATGYPTATATAKCDINGGKFIVEGTETFAVNKKAAKADFKISGGYWGGDGVNDNLAYYAVSPKKVLTLRESHTLYPDGYRYTVNEGGTVTWKNGDETLKTEMYESGETPEYTGETPTKTETAEYTYSHSGWDPTIEAMANADKTYTATYNHIEKKYTVNVVAGANGSVSPASVSGIGCVTASGDIIATPNTGYRLDNWTLPTGVTAADGYTVASNPISIHATASGKTITAHFAAKTYTVTLDNQSATTAGAASVTAAYNEAMPSIAANLPARTGYAFGGYFSETNGSGTQYYNADGTSAHIWDVDAASPTLYAKWTLNKYSFTIGVTPSSYGNVDVASITQIPHGSAVTVTGNKITVNGQTITATPTAKNAQYTYTFSTWQNVPTSVTGNVNNIQAVFTRTLNSYDVTFDMKGHGSAISGQTKDYGSKIDKPSDPSEAGYTFGGWYKESTCTNAWDFATDVVIGETTLFAKWTVNQYTITFDTDGGSAVASITQDYSSTVTPPANPTKKGYTFNGWLPAVPATMPVDGANCVAQWTINSYQIKFVDEDGTTNLGSYPQTLDYGAAVTAPEEPTKAADATNVYTFAGWSNGVSTYASADIPAVSGAVTYTATYSSVPTVASVTVGGATTYYNSIDAAFDYMNLQTSNTELKLLQDVTATDSLVYTPAAAITCTLDLNNHILSGSMAKLFVINLAGSTFVVTDKSAEKEGKILNNYNYNIRVYAVVHRAGTFKLQAGTIRAVNPHKYSSAAANKNSAATGVYFTNGYTFTMDGGKIESECQYASYGLQCKKGTSTVTINNGEISARTTASTTAYGIYTQAKGLTINNGTIKSFAKTSKSYAVYLNGGTATINGGYIEAANDTVSGGTASVYGIYAVYSNITYTGKLTIPSTSTVKVKAVANTTTAVAVFTGGGGATKYASVIQAGEFIAYTKTGKTAYGVYNQGHVKVSDGKFKVTSATTDAYGIICNRGTATVSGTPEFTVKATTSTAVGVLASGLIPSKGGTSYSGNIEVNGGKFNVSTGTSTSAMGAYASVATKSIWTTTSDSVPGNYAYAGTMTITAGEFNVTSYGSTSYALICKASTTQKKNTELDPMTATPKLTVTGGKFILQSNNGGNTTCYASNDVADAEDLLIQGGYYSSQAISSTQNLGDKYTAPMKDCNYHSLQLTAEECTAQGMPANSYEVAEACTITFKDSVAVLQSGLVKKGATPYYSGIPEKAETPQYSYEFSGWSPVITAVTGDATYTATYTETARVYSVSLNTNEGVINAGNVKNYTYGVGATLPTNVTKEGYTFGGWFDNSGLTGDAITSISDTTTGDKTYWAKWALKKCTITWLNWDGYPLTEPTITSTVNYGSAPGYSLVGNPTPTRESSDGKTYEWDGWTTGANGAGTFYSKDSLPNATGDATYYAHFRITAIDVASKSDISIDEDAEVTTTTVRVEGKLNVPENRTLTTDDLILEATPSSSGEITGSGTVTATHAYFDFSNGAEGFKARRWYAVAVPWQVDVKAYAENNGVYIINGSAAPVRQKMGKSFDLIYYDGALRAAEGHSDKCWKYVEDDDQEKHIMYPGRAYMIYLTSDAQTIRFEHKNDTNLLTNSLAVYKYSSGTENDKDADWNGIANPATYHAYLNVGATENIGQIYVAETKQYKQFNMHDSMLVVGQPIFVQPAVATTIVANAESYANNPSLAPRRTIAQETSMTRYEVMFAPNEGDVTDRIIVRLDEEKEENAYVVGQDLVKMGVSNIVPQMWVDRYDGKMCINTVAPVNNRADYPLGISVQQSGAYDLFIDDQPDDETMLYLTYDGEAIWNLSYGGYVVNLEKGSNTHYGLRIVRSPKVTTDIEEATILNGEAVRKVVIEDKVFIIRNDQIYGIDGRLAK